MLLLAYLIVRADIGLLDVWAGGVLGAKGGERGELTQATHACTCTWCYQDFLVPKTSN